MLPILVVLALLSVAPCQATDKNIEEVVEKITDILRTNENIFDPLFTFNIDRYYGYHPAWYNLSHVKVDSVKDLKVRIKEVKKTGDTTDVSCEMYFYPDVRGILKFQWEDDNEQIYKGVIDPMNLFAKQDPMAFTVDFSVKGEETTSPKIDIKSVKQTSTCIWGYSYKYPENMPGSIEDRLDWELWERQEGELGGHGEGQVFAPFVFQILKDNV